MPISYHIRGNYSIDCIPYAVPYIPVTVPTTAICSSLRLLTRPPTLQQGFPFLHVLAHTSCLLIDDDHSDRSEVVSHVAYIYISLMIGDVEPFRCVLAVCVSSLEK